MNNDKTTPNGAINGNGASCPLNPSSIVLGDLPLYEDQIVASYESGGVSSRPFLIDNVWDLQRVVDWLFWVGTDEKFVVAQEQTPAASVADSLRSLWDRILRRNIGNRKLFNVDPSRVGTTGISLGGLHSSLLGVVEQKRISVLAPAIGVPTFAWVRVFGFWVFLTERARESEREGWGKQKKTHSLFLLTSSSSAISSPTPPTQGAGHGDEWVPRAYSIPKVFLVGVTS